MREMKDSGIEWIGELPIGWETRKIKYVATLNGRIGWQGLTSSEYCDDGAYLITGIQCLLLLMVQHMVKQVLEAAHKLQDYLDSADKVDPAYQGALTATCCAVLADYAKKHGII